MTRLILALSLMLAGALVGSFIMAAAYHQGKEDGAALALVERVVEL